VSVASAIRKIAVGTPLALFEDNDVWPISAASRQIGVRRLRWASSAINHEASGETTMKRLFTLSVLGVALTIGALSSTAEAAHVRFGFGVGPSVGFYGGPAYGYRSYGRSYYRGYGYGGGYYAPNYGGRSYSPYYGGGYYGNPYYGGGYYGSPYYGGNYGGWCY
jgi:hypothetical protein